MRRATLAQTLKRWHVQRSERSERKTLAKVNVFVNVEAHADSEKSCNEVLRFAQPRWPSSRNFCARGAPKFFGDFAIFSRELAAKFA